MLEDLGLLALEAQKKCKEYDKRDIVLSDAFKKAFKDSMTSYEITFGQYTTIFTSKNELVIIAPNQWFIIASYFSKFLSQLLVYKKWVTDLSLNSEIKTIRETRQIDASTHAIISKKFDVDDIEKFKRFLTDYDWWAGSKTIDRGDFFVSAVLSSAGVINDSQSYIAQLALHLCNHQNLIEILQQDLNIHSKAPLKTDEVIISSPILKQIIFDTFKYILIEFGENVILENQTIKDNKIEDRAFKGISLPKFFGTDYIIGMFNNAQTPDLLKSSDTIRFFSNNITVLNNEHSYFTTQWSAEGEGRGRTLVNFNNYLDNISNSTLEIVKEEDIFRLIRKTTQIYSNPSSKRLPPQNTIYYGAPGTGKSYKVNEILKNLDTKFYERITFHPEYDHALFVGGYKPITVPVKYKDDNQEVYTEDEVKYRFVPQAFTNIYVRAWKDLENQYYLAIEEINRGNCAEIFGDIFQLLDRHSNYTVSPSEELKEYLIKALGLSHEGITNGLKLPPNLSLLATMNTSDQSLFPMDSAFRRRWDWDYIPICYDENEENKSSTYIVKIDENRSFKWLDFIKTVNLKIKQNDNLGMDKCIGNYFIKPSQDEITLKEFINKAIFYLWNDVFKDEEESDSIFLKGTYYEDFFPIETNGLDEIIKILTNLSITITSTLNLDTLPQITESKKDESSN
ncbi:hypothetical protein GCM10011514_48760 [Emticicia aquatilis]|uniref:ATPase dynein-related AAA domain-containing protein n=1 Tax=Emticicia aquatilis TaxID=1537369 RepID=A0A916Z841_9BACT|nr:AAA family ATPase [Emticicia aquatilis]GGD78978.1 hypothetical protein GCM10011514_48760 [Emticicia aquatilis]